MKLWSGQPWHWSPLQQAPGNSSHFLAAPVGAPLLSATPGASEALPAPTRHLPACLPQPGESQSSLGHRSPPGSEHASSGKSGASCGGAPAAFSAPGPPATPSPRWRQRQPSTRAAQARAPSSSRPDPARRKTRSPNSLPGGHPSPFARSQKPPGKPSRQGGAAAAAATQGEDEAAAAAATLGVRPSLPPRSRPHLQTGKREGGGVPSSPFSRLTATARAFSPRAHAGVPNGPRAARPEAGGKRPSVTAPRRSAGSRALQPSAPRSDTSTAENSSFHARMRHPFGPKQEEEEPGAGAVVRRRRRRSARERRGWFV